MKLLKFLNEEILISAALFLTDGKVFLAVVPTHKNYYDLPKGVQDKGEDITDTIVREIGEETGINLSQYRSKLQNIGKYNYRKGKDIILFILKLDELPKTSSMKCISMFKIKDMEYPEVGQYKYLKFDNLNGFVPGMKRIIRDAIRIIDNE